MKHKKMFAIVLLNLYLFTLLFSNITTVNATSAKTNDALADIIARGTIKIGSDTTYPPFESINETTSKAEGFDVDLANYIGTKMGVDVEIITSDWDPIIPNLQKGDFDIILSAMTITEEREQEVDFTRWYYQSFQAILVPNANSKNIESVDDLNKTGVKIGVQSGTTSFLFADENLTAATVQAYNDVPTAIAAMAVGDLDCVLGDYAVLALDAAQHDANKVVATFSPENFGIAVKTGETALLAKLNEILNGLLGSNIESPVYSADYSAMYEKWFETPPPKGVASPGFEFLGIFVIAVIPVIRKLKKNN